MKGEFDLKKKKVKDTEMKWFLTKVILYPTLLET